MKQCPNCHIQTPPNTLYCPQCGTSLHPSPKLLTNNKALDILAGFGLSFGLLIGLSVVSVAFISVFPSALWLYSLPWVGTVLAALYVYRRSHFAACGMIIPFLIVLLIFLGILILCRNI